MYLVCDGGGTKTEYMLFDLSGHIHGFSKTQGTNAIFINPDAAADAVCGGISDCLQQAGIRDTDLNEICSFPASKIPPMRCVIVSRKRG